ncbi:MAG: sigma-70 factor domain-containing protein, partial [Pirellulales bacterium]
MTTSTDKTLTRRRTARYAVQAARPTRVDPLRDYLEQLRNYPILSQEEETALARQLQDTRRRMRRMLLANPYMLAGTTEILSQVCQGQLRADRTLETTVFDPAAYRAATRGLPQIVWRLNRVLARNRRDAARLRDRTAPAVVWRPYARRVNFRTRAAATLAWEAKLRLNAVYPCLRQLSQIGRRVEFLARSLAESTARQPELEAELAQLVELTGVRPRRLSRWLSLVGVLMARYEALKQRLARHNLRLVVSI